MQPRPLFTLGSLLLCLAALGCRGPSRRLEPWSETVLSPGMTLRATNDNGTVTIVAGEQTLRTYTIDGVGTVERRLWVRRGRWNGSLGLYIPTHDGKPVVIAEEGRKHFASVDQAMRHFYEGSAHAKWVYTSDGLFVGLRAPQPRQAWQWPVFGVDVFQIYIDGRKPTALPGARDDQITVTGGRSPDTSTPYPGEDGHPMHLGDRRLDEATTKPAT